jgi:hypothetical protein
VCSYYYICVLTLLYMCTKTAARITRITACCAAMQTYGMHAYCYICVLILLYTCPAVCVIIPLYMRHHTALCPHTAIYVSSYSYMCPAMCHHTTIHVFPCSCFALCRHVVCMHTAIYVSSYCYISSVHVLQYLRPHTAVVRL